MSFELQRERLVENELRILGIRDEAVLRAMRIVPREAFVSEEMREFAYRNAPLPIGSGQTISQPLDRGAHGRGAGTGASRAGSRNRRRFGVRGGDLVADRKRSVHDRTASRIGRNRQGETQAVGL